MRTNFTLEGLGKVCGVTGRVLSAGDPFRTALFEEKGQLLRRDYAPEAWDGAPPGCIAFWQGRVPRQGSKSPTAIPDEVLFDCFLHMGEPAEPERQKLRYVLALLLMRRRKLRFVDATVEGGSEVMLLRGGKGAESYRVIDPKLTAVELETVQDDLFRVLGWD